MALWLRWHSESSIFGSGLGPRGTWFGDGISSSSGCGSGSGITFVELLVLGRVAISGLISSCRGGRWLTEDKN